MGDGHAGLGPARRWTDRHRGGRSQLRHHRHRRRCCRRCVEGCLALVLAAVLEPYRDDFVLQIELSCECLAFFARRVGGAVEELFEHGELGAGEALAGTFCGGVVGWCAEEGFVGGRGGRGGAEAGGGFGAEEVRTDWSHGA